VRIVSMLLFLSWAPVAMRAAPPQETLIVRAEFIRTPTVRFAVERAVAAAIEKLEQPTCQRVLSDFHTSSGRTLQEELDHLQDTPRRFLSRLTFHEEEGRRCADPRTLAFTSIGGREVFICSRQFWEAYRRNPTHVEALLIHEMLHTLGLGENPPSSPAITARVLQRCW
jgi:hypothetical protein